MCRLLETIMLRDGVLWNIDGHNERMNRSRRELFAARDRIDLGERIVVPRECASGTYRCRVVYARDIEEITVIPYRARQVRRLRVVASDIEYSHKFEDRSGLELLRERRGECDEIIIARNGLVTDASYANIAFFDGAGWVTPARPLLRGTRRRRLLDEGMLREEEILVTDLRHFSKASLINAMLDLGEIEVGIGEIVIEPS